MCNVMLVYCLLCHYIQYSALIHEAASAHVHHMLLYTCDGSGVDSFTNETLSGAECLTGNSDSSDPKLRCLGGNLVGAWAVGGSVRGTSIII